MGKEQWRPSGYQERVMCRGDADAKDAARLGAERRKLSWREMEESPPRDVGLKKRVAGWQTPRPKRRLQPSRAPQASVGRWGCSDSEEKDGGQEEDKEQEGRDGGEREEGGIMKAFLLVNC
jgi:hypothetical protein